MPKMAILVGPQDNGRPMSLADFDHAEVQPGYLYELGRGIVVVSDVPNFRHLAQHRMLRRQLDAYDLSHPGRIYAIAGSGECKLLIAALESERHPDICVYKYPPPDTEDIWSTWVPDIAIEIVSLSSAYRDYHEKPEEYLRFGVREYWIVNADRREMQPLRAVGGRWTERTIRPPKTYRTRLPPGFELELASVFRAADEAGR